MKPVRILSNSEVAQMYKDSLDGTDIVVPWNVVSPPLLKELQNKGVEIDYGYQTSVKASYSDRFENDGAMFSVRNIVDSNGFDYGKGVYLYSDDFDELTEKEQKQKVRDFIKNIVGKSFPAKDKNGNEYNIFIAGANEKFHNKNGKRVNVNHDLVYMNDNNEIKRKSLLLVDELIETSWNNGEEKPRHGHDWPDNNGKRNFDLLKTIVEDSNGGIYDISMIVANADDGRKILYDISRIKK